MKPLDKGLQDAKKGRIRKAREDYSKYLLPPSKHKLGYTEKEINKMLLSMGIKSQDFWKAFGVNTCAVHPKTGEGLFYECDVETAIVCCVEKRGKYSYEWD